MAMGFSSSTNSTNLATRTPPSSSTENQENIVKDIEKCGYISLKLAKDNESTSVYQRFWAMFYVINDERPILELFTKEQEPQQVNNLESIFKINLKTTHHISVPILFNDKENNNEFVISLDNQLIQVYVDNKELLDEWVACLRTKLASLNVFSPKDNIYSKEPIMNAMKKSINNRPLPPLPTEQSRSSLRQHLSRPMERLIDGLQGRMADRRRTNERNHLNSLNAATASSSTQFDHQANSATLNSYENLAISNPVSPFNADSQYNTLSSYRSSTQSNASHSNQVLSLRESQILQLQKEITNRAGVKLRIRKIDCLDSLALVEWLGHIFVAGWKQRFCPQLHNLFKIGDEIISVNGYKATSAKDVHCIIKQSDEPIIEFIIRRTPYGRAFLLKREFAGQELGKQQMKCLICIKLTVYFSSLRIYRYCEGRQQRRDSIHRAK